MPRLHSLSPSFLTFHADALSAYDYIASLPGRALNWEFIRRNPDYWRDWRINRAGRAMPVQLRTGTALIRIRRRFRLAEIWNLHFFR